MAEDGAKRVMTGSSSSLGTSPRRISLPVEVLHMIIAAIYPNGYWLTLESQRWRGIGPSSESLSTLQACCLVCWQWHAIALPHLFHTVEISSSSRLEACLEFFQDTPTISKLVRVLVLRPGTVPVCTLDKLLGNLPSLKRLHVSDSVVCNPIESTYHVPRRPYTLQALYYRMMKQEPDTQCRSIMWLLFLFSSVNYLSVHHDGPQEREANPAWPPVTLIDNAVSLSRELSRELRVHMLQCDARSFPGYFIQEYLRKTGGANNIAILISTYRWSLTRTGSDIIYAARNSLQFLIIQVHVGTYMQHATVHTIFTYEPFQGSRARFEAIANALPACKCLKSVVIQVYLSSAPDQYVRLPDGHVCRAYPDHQEAWRQVLCLLNLIPTNCLRRATIHLVCLINDPHALDWDGFIRWQMSLPPIEPVTLRFEQAYDQQRCFAFETRAVSHLNRCAPKPRWPSAASYVVTLPPGSRVDQYTCQHKQCRTFWEKMGGLSRSTSEAVVLSSAV